MRDDELSIEIQPDPLALMFEKQTGEITSAPIDAATGIAFMIGFLDAPCVFEAVRLPSIVKRWLRRRLYQSWQKYRLAQFKQC